MSTDLSANAWERLYGSLQSEFEYYLYRLIRRLEEACESPIEVMLGTALTVVIELAPIVGLKLYAQYEWHQYRLDFALLFKDIPLFFVECDGHDFHERTKEQAAYDRQKDRAALAAAVPILRFTGSQIYRDPQACALEIINFLTKEWERRRLPTQ